MLQIRDFDFRVASKEYWPLKYVNVAVTKRTLRFGTCLGHNFTFHVLPLSALMIRWGALFNFKNTNCLPYIYAIIFAKCQSNPC